MTEFNLPPKIIVELEDPTDLPPAVLERLSRIGEVSVCRAFGIDQQEGTKPVDSEYNPSLVKAIDDGSGNKIALITPKLLTARQFQLPIKQHHPNFGRRLFGALEDPFYLFVRTGISKYIYWDPVETVHELPKPVGLYANSAFDFPIRKVTKAIVGLGPASVKFYGLYCSELLLQKSDTL